MEAIRHQRIVTGSGFIIAPVVKLNWFSTFGIRMENFEVVAHTIPFSGPIDGLLGMDFLRKNKARVDIGDGIVELP